MDPANLPGLWSLSPLGALLLVLVVIFWLIATGKLITLSSHLRELELERERANEWKAAAGIKDAVIDKQGTQISSLIESGRTLTYQQPEVEEITQRPNRVSGGTINE
jgi:hypothetical protein